MMPSYGARPVQRRKRFDEYFRCYPIKNLGRDASLNYGGKIMLPPSALDKLTRLHIAYPMVFELHAQVPKEVNGVVQQVKTKTHAGVLEFIAEEGRVYLPEWMMRTLGIKEGHLLQLKSTDLPPGKFIKIQAQKMVFIERVSNPKVVLEKVLQNYTALTKNDIIQFLYNDEVFDLKIVEVKYVDPGYPEGIDAITCVEIDLEVDFETPPDYVEPTATSRSGQSRAGHVVGGGNVTPLGEGTMAKAIGYTSLTTAPAGSASAFTGTGNRLKNSRTGTPATKPSTPVAGTSTNQPPQPAAAAVKKAGPQPLRLPIGQLFFGYDIVPLKKEGEDKQETKPSMFSSGGGQTLRSTTGKKRKGEDVKGKGRSKNEPIELD
ncbi:ubiquitin fusion degradation protein UFD1-domain-containing protein [Pyronema omphalodes]|nr:ubiquitin fusion degradation protein UFD1-domain-containing protein [Pyronema omphalodes]